MYYPTARASWKSQHVPLILTHTRTNARTHTHTRAAEGGGLQWCWAAPVSPVYGGAWRRGLGGAGLAACGPCAESPAGRRGEAGYRQSRVRLSVFHSSPELCSSRISPVIPSPIPSPPTPATPRIPPPPAHHPAVRPRRESRRMERGCPVR